MADGRGAPRPAAHLGRVRNGLWYFEHSLFEAAEDLLREWRERFPDMPPALRFGSWIGGDMDGNPSAGAATIGEARSRAHTLARERYRDRVRALAVELSPHRSFVGVTEELEESLARDERELSGYAADIGAQNEREPYRRKLSFVWWRLDERRLRIVRRAARRPRGHPAQPRGASRQAPVRARRCASADRRDLRLRRREAGRARARGGPRR